MNFYALLQRAAISLLGWAMVLGCADIAKADSDGWTVSTEGQTIMRSFQNAPYPHSSRAKGFTYSGTFFDAAGHYNDSTVGIFIPANYQPSETVDFVVHFHGWSNHVASVLDHYELRQQFARSGVNAILLASQGPKDATDSGGGKLELDAGAFEALINEVTDFLVQAGKIRTHRIGHIVLSTHSGGYKVTGAVLAHGGLRDHITDVLLFDSSYGELEAFTNWAAEGHQHRLVTIFTRHLAPENFMLLTMLQRRHAPVETILEPDLNARELLPRRTLFIHTLDLAHDEIMQKRGYLALFLQTSALAKIAR